MLDSNGCIASIVFPQGLYMVVVERLSQNGERMMAQGLRNIGAEVGAAEEKSQIFARQSCSRRLTRSSGKRFPTYEKDCQHPFLSALLLRKWFFSEEQKTSMSGQNADQRMIYKPKFYGNNARVELPVFEYTISGFL
ncbi:hypothetical protein SADUNF_Sadunf06G0178800 [Salix dunnii]|uniref:Uncharacterized protein n=1 Tax=Salix dunnii TaxID=1413687 RepID=A0A835JZM1_9ROSI|nr:hypothetical protein SADUNF_Sadunf06G0178800 [Salix dunnii]